MFGRARPQGRNALLEEAARARARGRHRKALRLYRQALALDPTDPAVEARLARCMVEAGEAQEARIRYHSAARAYESRGFADKASAVLREATKQFPRDPELWEGIAALHEARGRRADAVATLLEARTHLTRRRDRDALERILRAVLRLDPQHFEVTVALARVLIKTDRREEATTLLNRIRTGRTQRELREVAALELRVSPRPRTLFRWLRAA